LAITKERKSEMLERYQNWLAKSQAVFMTEYFGMTMSDFDTLRSNLREVGGEFHVVKNTINRRVFESAGYEINDDLFLGSSAIGYAFSDPPAVAKVISDYATDSDIVTIKGGYLESQYMTADEIKALADLPPLPVLRAQLMGTILAPASKLVRVLAEPGRQVAAVLRAYSETEGAPAEA
jgi:large subunit ribosomal protein L10